ncbi:hypothetical protein Clacol_002005 [Clathrus columnatus]|uniref:Mediator of RNA polymerase II transcription subunit 13 n=1 Tax=Clathrus columnatus TaxID=1419009 RepID=A0AAV5A0M2_9AGAM|nr:hypothetical protein Clacol_002005 [Clathrus columnatus]
MTPSKPPRKSLRHLAENSQTLHCRYPLPPNPTIIYARFSPDNNIDDPYKIVENARQSLIKDTPENNTSLVGLLLPFVNISNSIINLWIFCIRSPNSISASIQGLSPKGKEKAPAHLFQELESLAFEGLQRVDLSDFTPNDLFSCSAECAALTRSCPACARSTCDETSQPPTSAVLLPRLSLQDAYSMFIYAVRERLIDNICSPNLSKENSMTMGADSKHPLRAIRFGQGFLTIEECFDSLWGFGWKRSSQSRHLIHTALDVYLTPTAIYIRPLPTVTNLSPISPTPPESTFCTPLSPGTPLVLAPYPTPAFYISTHASSTIPSSLRNEFWHALKGLGALGYPETAKVRSTSHSRPSILPESKFSHEDFILVYIFLNNPQGDPRGLPALWPAHLTFVDTDPSRIRLTTLPEIPGIETLLTPPRPSINAVSVSDMGSLVVSPSQALDRTIFRNSFKRLRNTQRVMRTLELHSRRRIPRLPIHEAAKSTAGYVESVAKEREKEREKANLERLRREKEGKDKTPLAGSVSGSVSTQQTPVPTPSTPTISGATVPPKPSQDIVASISSWRSTSGQFFARTAQDSTSYSFYPSPPDCNPFHVSAAGTAELASGTFGLSSVSAPSAQYTPSALPASDNVRTSAMGMPNEMDLGMDIDLSDINIGINLSRSMNMMDVNGDSDLVDVDGGFGGFGDTLITDDDFDYFDKSIVPEPSSLDKGIPSWLRDALTSEGIIPPVLPSSQQLNDPSEPEDIMVAPELLPSTPTARSPPTPNNPRTPSLEVLNPLGSPRDRLFDPVYFGDRHHIADDKYTGSQGKYLLRNLQSMATPPPEDVLIGRKRDGWRFRYDSLTDPRIGVVNRLRGLKRKLDSHSRNTKSLKQGSREEEWESIFSEEEDAEEIDSSSSCDENEEELDTMELDYDRLDVRSRESFSRPSTPPPVGHPLSPSLLYFRLEYSLLLPLGIAMRPSFKELVSSETPSVAISVPTPVSPAAALGSASERNKTLEMLAQAMSKENVENSLWSHACGLTPPFSSPPRFSIPQEHVNRLSALFKKIPGIEAALPLSALLDVASDIPPPAIFSSPKLKLLSPPKFCLGRAGLVHQVLPSAIRFWEKEGLGPRGGTKDVVAFCLFQDGEERATIVTSWLQRVARTYAARGLGAHVPGDAGPFTNGLVPLHFESVRKVLAQLMTALSLIPHVPRIVIYIISPPTLCSSLDSPTLRSIIRSRKYIPKLAGQRDFDNDRVLFHFVPESYIADPYVYPCTRYLGLEQFVQSVYDRLLRVCSRPVPSRSSMSLIHIDNRLQAPAFVLARPGPPETHFQWEGRPSLNVTDRYTFLHVGYRLSKCKKWLLAACIDERGEAHDLAIWNVPYHSEDDQTVGGDIDVNIAWIVENIWLFTSQFAKRSDTEWKIVLSRFDGITASEVEAWMLHLEMAVMNPQGRPLHVSLVCAQNDIPLALLSNTGTDESQSRPFSMVPPPGSVFVDASSLTYSVSFPGRAPIILTSYLYPTDQPSILGPSPTETDMDTTEDDTDTPLLPMETPTPVIPLCTSSLFTVSNTCNESIDTGGAMGDSALLGALYIHMLYAGKTPKSTLRKNSEEMLADITKSWYDLSVLTKERWRIPDGNWNGNDNPLPFHLAALDVMLTMLVIADTPRKEVGSV